MKGHRVNPAKTQLSIKVVPLLQGATEKRAITPIHTTRGDDTGYLAAAVICLILKYHQEVEAQSTQPGGSGQKKQELHNQATQRTAICECT